MLFKKNIGLGKTKFNLFIFLFLIIPFFAYSEQNQVGSYTNIKILDKISSKNILVKLKNGEGRAEALANTQKEFRKHPIKAWRHPNVWAAFQLSGDWRPIDF